MEYNKRFFTARQCYGITLKGFEHISDMMSARKKGLMSKTLMHHIMLAVTEVNGCAMCAFYHAKEALESGTPQEDIEKLLGGSFEHMDEDEAVALAFAQHYADTAGKYSDKAWQRVVDTYGMEKARGIMAAVRAIMWGNAYGIAWGALERRIKGKPEKNSTLWQEIWANLSIFPFLPIGLVRGLFIKKYK